METKNHLESGFSLVEVLIASAIGVLIFYYLNSSLVQIQETQRRVERREMQRQIRSFLETHLSDYSSWRENPDFDILTSHQASRLYYFSNPLTPLSSLAYSIDAEELSRLDLHQKEDCLEQWSACHFALFTNQGQLLSKEELINEETQPFYSAIIGIKTPEDILSRNFLPEFEVKVRDHATSRRVRSYDHQFFVNTSSASPEDSNLYDRSTALARQDCFLHFASNHPEIADEGVHLCLSANSAAPAECYEKMHQTSGTSHPISMVTCSQARNLAPYNCFRKARRELRESNSQLAILCNRADSYMPIECAKRVREAEVSSNQNDIFRLCHRARDYSSADCYIEMLRANRSYRDMALSLCRN